jgi:hypothetical protein
VGVLSTLVISTTFRLRALRTGGGPAPSPAMTTDLAPVAPVAPARPDRTGRPQLHLDEVADTISDALEAAGGLAWLDDAACADAPFSLFFAKHGTDTYTPARDLCGACPVLASCQAYGLALAAGRGMVAAGVIAKMSPTERLEHTRRRTRRTVRHHGVRNVVREDAAAEGAQARKVIVVRDRPNLVAFEHTTECCPH